MDWCCRWPVMSSLLNGSVGIWVESPLSLAWIGLARLSKPALLAEHVATVSS